VRKKNYDAALGSFGKAVEIKPDFYVGFNNRGEAYFLQGEYSAAAQDFKKALELNPKYSFVYNNMGVMYAQQGRHKEAIDMYTKAIQLDENYGAAYFHRANSYELLQDFEHGCQDLQKARSVGFSVPGSFLSGCN